MPTFTVKNNPELTLPIQLSKDDEHHLRKVLRVKTGEIFFVTDNEGMIGQVKIMNTNPFEFKLIEKQNALKPFPITMNLPLIDQDRLEWAIEKLCELNVETVQLVITERTQNKNFSEKKFARLEKVSETAQKQCGRAYPLKIFREKKLKEISFDPNKNYFVGAWCPRPGEEPSPLQASASKTPISYDHSHVIFVGPEGGFTESETNFLTEHGAKAVSLGPNTLRTETAAIVFVTRVLS